MHGLHRCRTMIQKQANRQSLTPRPLPTSTLLPAPPCLSQKAEGKKWGRVHGQAVEDDMEDDDVNDDVIDHTPSHQRLHKAIPFSSFEKARRRPPILVRGAGQDHAVSTQPQTRQPLGIRWQSELSLRPESLTAHASVSSSAGQQDRESTADSAWIPVNPKQPHTLCHVADGPASCSNNSDLSDLGTAMLASSAGLQMLSVETKEKHGRPARSSEQGRRMAVGRAGQGQKQRDSVELGQREVSVAASIVKRV